MQHCAQVCVASQQVLSDDSSHLKSSGPVGAKVAAGLGTADSGNVVGGEVLSGFKQQSSAVFTESQHSRPSRARFVSQHESHVYSTYEEGLNHVRSAVIIPHTSVHAQTRHAQNTRTRRYVESRGVLKWAPRKGQHKECYGYYSTCLTQ